MAGMETRRSWSLRGRDFTPLLKGQRIRWNNSYYAEYSTHHQSQTHMRMITVDGWKLVRDFKNPDRDELYHLDEDPGESRNLIHSNALQVTRVIRELHGQLVGRMKQHGDEVHLQ